MGCACTDKKKMSIDYIRRLGNAFSITNKVDIQIYYTVGYDGKTKYYDYERVIGGRKLQIVEVIRFSEPESISILPDIEQSGFDLINTEEEVTQPADSSGVKRKARKSTSPDSGSAQ